MPLLLAGLGIGALASQLGAVTVSAVPDEDSPAVGGLQNTATNLGAALGTALAGSILIASLSAAFLQGVQGNPAIPQQLQIQATTQLASGVPFVSDAQLQTALTKAGVPGRRHRRGRGRQQGSPRRGSAFRALRPRGVRHDRPVRRTPHPAPAGRWVTPRQQRIRNRNPAAVSAQSARPSSAVPRTAPARVRTTADVVGTGMALLEARRSMK